MKFGDNLSTKTKVIERTPIFDAADMQQSNSQSFLRKTWLKSDDLHNGRMCVQYIISSIKHFSLK